uniref:Secreted protein n=2 Tax=Mycobacteriaceae TaxID=1762 RepID=V5XEQ7_MYCNE
MSYDLGMRRLVLAVPMVSVAALLGAGSATAAPEQGCAVTLQPPTVVQDAGVRAVVASVSPGACNRAVPQLQVACLQQAGSPVAPLCVQSEGPGTAEVRFSPYTPGAGYIVSGRVCANAGSPPVTYCSTVGPTTVIL